MTEKQWQKLREQRPDLKLISWNELGWTDTRKAKAMNKSEVVSQVTAGALLGDPHEFTIDVTIDVPF